MRYAEEGQVAGEGSAPSAQLSRGCEICEADAAFLRSARPPYEDLRPKIRVVDLFAGCGGLTLGAAEAARRLGLGVEVRLAVDKDETAIKVFGANFRAAQTQCVDVEELFDGCLGDGVPTDTEAGVKDSVGPVDILLGGPPCQGHSDLNNHTRRADPRNALYSRMARAAEVFKPTLVMVENVPTVTHDVSKVVDATVERLRACGYVVAEGVIDISRLGAPQRRRRHVVLASRDRRVDVDAIVGEIGPRCSHHPRSVRWAIGDLVIASANGIYDSASVPSEANQERIAWLFDKGEFDLPNRLRPACHQSDHSYTAMYGRLKWTEPAQTLTTGFGSMGQGRYVHPSQRRTITPHEAARLQMLPDFWDFSSVTKRGQLARLIGNAVPPVLAASLLEPALRSLGLAPEAAFPNEVHGHRDLTVRAGRRTRKVARVRGRTRVPDRSSPKARARMLRVRRACTAPEFALRVAVDRLGLRYLVDQPIAGTKSRADLLFEDAGVVVMVDDCFWDACPIHRASPNANTALWEEKLNANRRRDEATDLCLHDLGWVILRFWEHDDPEASALKVAMVVAARRMERNEPLRTTRPAGVAAP
jgi:DNA (cytosine-5)-methyltransferase 1